MTKTIVLLQPTIKLDGCVCYGKSQPGRKANMKKGKTMGNERIWHDSFAQFAYVRYKLFRQWYCMQNSLFLQRVKSMTMHNSLFAQKYNVAFLWQSFMNLKEKTCAILQINKKLVKRMLRTFWWCCNHIGQQFKILKDFGIDRLWATSCCICDSTQHDYQRWIWFGFWILFWSTWSFTWEHGLTFY